MTGPTSRYDTIASAARVSLRVHLFGQLWLALALMLVASRPVHAQLANKADQPVFATPEIIEFRIKGTKAMSTSDIRDGITTQPTSCKVLLFKFVLKPVCAATHWSPLFIHRFLDEDEFKRDILRVKVYYYRRGYRDTQVDTALVRTTDNKVRITMTITEGLPTVVKKVTVRGIGSAIARGDTARTVRPRVGDPLNLLALDTSVARIRTRLQDKGYADARIKSKAEANDSTRVGSTEITVDRNRPVTIGDIGIVGNTRISDETIRNSLSIHKGDLFKASSIASSQRALYQSALFRRAAIDTGARNTASGISTATDSTSRPDTVKNLVVSVVEGPEREASTSFGFTTADFVQAQGTFTHHYLMNRPLTLDANVTVGNLLARQLTKSSAFVNIADIVPDNDNLGQYYDPTYQASLNLTQRYVGSPRNTVSGGVFLHRRSSPGVLVDRGYGASATFTRELATKVPLSLNYQFEETRVDAGDVYFCVNYGVCDKPTINALRGQQRLSPLTLAISVDQTDIPFSPTRGIVARAELEHASQYTASNFHYNRASLDVAAYHKIGRGNTLVGNPVIAAHVRAGWVGARASTAGSVGDGLISNNVEILHPRKRFYAGGSQSVRGFGENQLGPRVLTVPAETLVKGAIVGTDTIVCAATSPSAKCLAGLNDNAFSTRPLGGTTLLEGSVELRIPLTRSFVGALFLDGAVLGNGGVSTITQGTGAVTPGFGIRYQSPVGPIRVDLGIRPTLKSALPVITEVKDSTGRYRLVDLTNGAGCPTQTSVGCRVYPGPLGKQSFLNRITNRLTLHLSIGEAY
jgi:outer membrane protein insertion porin family